MILLQVTMFGKLPSRKCVFASKCRRGYN